MDVAPPGRKRTGVEKATCDTFFCANAFLRKKGVVDNFGVDKKIRKSLFSPFQTQLYLRDVTLRD